MKFRCWVPNEGYTREDASDVEAFDEEDAASEFAEKWYQGGDHFSQLDVRVAAWGSGNSSEKTFRVSVDFDPMFTATEVAA